MLRGGALALSTSGRRKKERVGWDRAVGVVLLGAGFCNRVEMCARAWSRSGVCRFCVLLAA